jgi:hypothetical protein
MALASDTDNTGESAHAGFADFHFVAEKEACADAMSLSIIVPMLNEEAGIAAALLAVLREAGWRDCCGRRRQSR